MIWFYGVWTQRKRCNKMITIIIYTLHGRCIRNCWLFPLCHLAMTLFMWMGVCVFVYWKQQAYTDFYRTLCCTSLWTVDSNDQTETRCQNMHFSFLSLRHTQKKRQQQQANRRKKKRKRNWNHLTFYSGDKSKQANSDSWAVITVLCVVRRRNNANTSGTHVRTCVAECAGEHKA